MNWSSKIKSLWGEKQTRVSTDELISEMTAVRAKSSLLAFTGKPYGNDWRGMYNGAVALFPGALVAVPHRQSKNIFSEDDLKKISHTISDLKFERIVFSGYAECLKELLLSIHKHAPAPLRDHIFLTHHGSLSSHGEIPVHASHLHEIMGLNQHGIIRRLGFFKKGLAETLNKITGIDSHFLINIGNENDGVKTQTLSGLHAGVFTHNSFRKNLHNQVAAALMLEQATVHVHDDHDFEYLNSAGRLRAHPFTESYDDFLKVLGSMSLNFYVTFSECYGLVIAESLSLGVPCLASNSSGFFDYDEFLARSLVVEEYDNSEAIFRKAQEALANRKAIAARGNEYVKKLNAMARGKLHDFLNS